MTRTLPPHVYLRRGKYLYFERGRGKSVRLHHEPGTVEFAYEYAVALGDILPPVDYEKRKLVYGEFHTPTGGCHFKEIEDAARRRAKRANRRFELPDGWAKEQFERQGGACAITGVKFHKDRIKHAPLAPSIDRVRNGEGYTPDNCHLVTYIVNCAKNQFTVDEFVTMCRAVVKKHGMHFKQRKNRAPYLAPPVRGKDIWKTK